MNNRQSYLSLETTYLAEGIEEITTTRERNNCRESSPIVHSDLLIKGHLAQEDSQIDLEYKGKDDIDSQDAAMTTEEIRTSPHRQRVPHVSSNDKPVNVKDLMALARSKTNK